MLKWIKTIGNEIINASKIETIEHKETGVKILTNDYIYTAYKSKDKENERQVFENIEQFLKGIKNEKTGSEMVFLDLSDKK